MHTTSTTANSHRAPPLLSTVCLCAIVRDESSNPAGGIQLYLNRILSYVHTAIIVDTGSKDTTLDILHSARSLYSHLHVYQTTFESFAQARNYALDKVEEVRTEQVKKWNDAVLTGKSATISSASASASSSSSSTLLLPPFRHILVLDADEELTLPVIEVLAEVLKIDQTRSSSSSIASSNTAAAASSGSIVTPVSPSSSRLPFAIKFSCHCYDANGASAPRSNSGLWNPRVFSSNKGFRFVNLVDDYRFERLMYNGKPLEKEWYVRSAEVEKKTLKKLQEIMDCMTNENQGGGGGGVDDGSGSTNGSMDAGDSSASSSAASNNNHHAASASSTTGGSPSSLDDSFLRFNLTSSSPSSDYTATSSSSSAASSDGSSSSSLLIPMRHYIPSLAERRKKNKRYKAGGTALTVTKDGAADSTQQQQHPASSLASSSPVAPSASINGGGSGSTSKVASVASSPTLSPMVTKKAAKSRIFLPSH